MLPAPIQKEVLFEPFPKQQEFIDAALGGKYDFICYGGAIRGGKTFALLGLFLILCRIFPGSRWAIVRKDLPTIKKNLFPSWNKIKPTNFIPRNGHNHDTQTVTFKNGSQIVFFPELDDRDKDKNRWKGLEVNGFGFEEINECQEASLNKAFERAGSYIVKGLKVQPKPLVVATCNPTFGWVKNRIYTPHKEGKLSPKWLYIQSRIYDNLPLLSAQPDYLPSLKANLKTFEYMVFVDGDWDVQLKTGGEFLRGFELEQHVQPLSFNPDYPLHISLDSNVYPYIAISCWQIVDEEGIWKIRQIMELPASDPDNTASRAGKKIADWLTSIDYKQKVFLYGDRSTKARNNIDDQKRSFFDIVNENILNEGFRTEDKMLSFAPPPASMADYVNAIFTQDPKDKHLVGGMRIEIGENCKESINDYILTKTDENGNILKIRKADFAGGPSYEHHGHLCDTLKDFIVQAFYESYQAWETRHLNLVPGGLGTISRKPKYTL
jgi:hypothetical protein